jgi:glycosyltransferase involved in cell wall biosynthesis
VTPLVSIVVATHNRAERLAALLDSLTAQTFSDFEVVVSDDASTDATAEILARPREYLLRVARSEQAGGPARARNRGVQLAHGELIAFTDDDCVASPGWLAAGVRAWNRDPARFVQGPVAPIAAERDRLGAFSYSIIVEGPTHNYECANIFYPRALLERVNGFDESFTLASGEDADLGWRAREAGATPVFEPLARVEHAVVELGAFGYLRRLWKWSDAMRPYALHPQMRRHLHYGFFWNLSHYLLARAVLGALLARRRWAWPLSYWLAKWFLAYELAESRAHAGTPWLAPWWVVRDVVEMTACARGALRYRAPVL